MLAALSDSAKYFPGLQAAFSARAIPGPSMPGSAVPQWDKDDCGPGQVVGHFTLQA
jgi:hypothetical protein